MSVFVKSQVTITDEIMEELKKKHRFLLKKTYTTELGTSHEFVIKPLSYAEYVESVENLYVKDSMDDKYGVYDVSARLLIPQIIYPEVDFEDFKIEENPTGFLFNLMSNFQSSFAPLPNESFLYYDDYKKSTSMEQREDFMKSLSDLSKEHMFCLGIIYEDNLNNMYYFIFNKLKNSQIENIRKIYIEKKEQIFEQMFGSYTPEIKIRIRNCVTDNLTMDSDAAEKLLAIFKDPAHQEQYIKKVAAYNDYVTIKLLNMHDSDIVNVFRENILYAKPYPIDVCHAQIVTALYGEMNSPIRINRIVPLIEGKELVDEFCKKFSIPVSELEIFMQKLSDQN